jgi:hypothetical protein
MARRSIKKELATAIVNDIATMSNTNRTTAVIDQLCRLDKKTLARLCVMAASAADELERAKNRKTKMGRGDER